MKTYSYHLLALALCTASFNSTNAQSYGPYGPGASDVRAIVLTSKNVMAGTYGGIYVYSGGVLNWSSRNVGLSDTSVNALAVSGNTVVAGTTNSGIFYSTDYGDTWNPSNQTDSRVWALKDSGANLFAGTSCGVFRSTNHGKDWTAAGLMGVRVISLAIKDTNLFAGLDGGGVRRSTNNGLTWDTTGLSMGQTNALAFKSGEFLAGTSNGILLSTDLGNSWTDLDSGLTDKHICSLIFVAPHVFAGTDSGSVFSFNGSVWYQYFPRFTFNPIRAIAYTSREDNTPTYEPSSTQTWFFATSGSGVFVGSLTSVSPERDQVPSQFRLMQNFPNPFNPSTTISFDLSKSGNVRLEIFDVLGRSVARVFEGFKPAGHHAVEFDATNLTTGTYFYELEFEGFCTTKRMLLLR